MSVYNQSGTMMNAFYYHSAHGPVTAKQVRRFVRGSGFTLRGLKKEARRNVVDMTRDAEVKVGQTDFPLMDGDLIVNVIYKC